MEQSVLQTLEFDKILARVAKHAESGLGKELVLALQPETSLPVIEKAQAETADAVSLLLQVGDPPLFGIYPIRAAVKRAALGGVLSMPELLRVSETLREAEALTEYVQEADPGDLVSLIRGLFVQPGLQREISDAILTEDTMADTASRTLYSIRQSMRAKQDQVKAKLNEILSHLANAGYLNENLITMRDGRYVLPVKAAYRSHVKGVVHDSSGSGQTVFVEPMAVVELNNEIRKLEAEEEEEIQRILAGLSQSVAEFSEEIAGDEEALAFIDFTFAKGKYALEIRAVRPTFTANRVIDLAEARHPLLEGSVVPIDIRLGEEFSTLIITGPNTGGKTVTLKTLGLLQVMAQSGLEIPVRQPSKVGVFSSLFADIGDRQSIEQSLSTFSASMTNIVRILEQADEESLLLFDELGSGTDPTEGAAMAMAILGQLTRRGIRTVATTHYAELKLFAIREEGVQNASVEFNVETLSPTYRLLIGLPGRSNAFEISRRLGLSDHVLSEAQEYLDHGNIRFETVLADIEKSRREAEEERVKMRAEREAYRQKLAGMQEELQKAQARYEKQQAKAEEEAQKLVEEARKTAQEMIRSAKDALSGERPELDRKLNEINETSKSFDKKHRKAKPSADRKGPQNLHVGESVKILSLNQSGILVEGPDAQGDVMVQMGILKVRSNVKDLARVEGEASIQMPGGVQTKVVQQKAMEQTPQLDIRGKRFEEAMDLVDKYLDDSVLAGYNKVRIIHGKGTGALRKGIHDRLKKDRRVASYDYADAREGGSGATDVVLK